MPERRPAVNWDALLARASTWFAIERLTRNREDDLCDFFRAAYRDQPAAQLFEDDAVIRRRVRWLDDQNPVPFDGAIPAWICLQKGRIVGHVGALAAQAAARGALIPICWGRDLIVAPEVRRLGAGPLLIMTAVREAQRPFLVAGLNDDAYSLYRQLGFHDSGTIPLFVKVRDARRLLDTMPWPRLKRLAAAGLLAAAQRFANRPRHRDRSLVVEPIERFDDEFDRWWAGVEPAFGCVVQRTSGTLTWRYQNHPSHRYQCFAARSGATLRGIVIVRHGRSRGLPAGFISELLAHPDDRTALDSLLGYAAELLLASGTETPVFVRCSALHPSFEAALARAGFLRAPSPLRWMQIHPPDASASASLLDRDRWLITAGDSDLDML